MSKRPLNHQLAHDSRDVLIVGCSVKQLKLDLLLLVAVGEDDNEDLAQQFPLWSLFDVTHLSITESVFNN